MNECREAFEKWAPTEGFALTKLPESDGYAYWRTHEAWVGWQAAWNYKEKSDEA